MESRTLTCDALHLHTYHSNKVRSERYFHWNELVSTIVIPHRFRRCRSHGNCLAVMEHLDFFFHPTTDICVCVCAEKVFGRCIVEWSGVVLVCLSSCVAFAIVSCRKVKIQFSHHARCRTILSKLLVKRSKKQQLIIIEERLSCRYVDVRCDLIWREHARESMK